MANTIENGSKPIDFTKKKTTKNKRNRKQKKNKKSKKTKQNNKKKNNHESSEYFVHSYLIQTPIEYKERQV